MAAAISRAAAAAAPPRTSSPGLLSSCRRFIPYSVFPTPSVPGNSGRASSSDSWIRDKAVRTSLAPPPIDRRDDVKVVGRASLSHNWVADKRRSVIATPAPAARAVPVPPPVNKSLPVDISASPAAADRTDLSLPSPVDTSASPAAAARTDLSLPSPVDTSASPVAAARADLSPPSPTDTLPSPATPVPVVRADLQVEGPVPVATTPAPLVGADLQVEEPLSLRADQQLKEPLVATTPAPLVSADLQLEELLASRNVNATPAPAVCAPLTKLERQEGPKIAGCTSLSKSWVVDKLLASGVTTSSFRGAESGGRSKQEEEMCTFLSPRRCRECWLQQEEMCTFLSRRLLCWPSIFQGPRPRFSSYPTFPSG